MSLHNLSKGDEKLIEQILEKSAIDQEFRARLLENPNEAIQEIVGFELPLTVRFTEKPEGVDAYVVLPEFVSTDVELSEAELEAVAGGGITDWCVCTETSTCECTLFTCIRTGGTTEISSY